MDRARVVRRAKSQTALAMIFPGPSRRDPSRHAAQVWAAIASGLGGRLFEELRERRSLAYTVIASTWQRAGAGALVTYIATSPERESEAREAMLLELARFQEQPVTERELDQAVHYLGGQVEVQRDTGASVALVGAASLPERRNRPIPCPGAPAKFSSSIVKVVPSANSAGSLISKTASCGSP